MMIKMFWEKLKPSFWDAAGQEGTGKTLFNYRRVWLIVVVSIGGVAILPLLIMTFMNLSLYEKAMRAEINYPLARLISNTRRSLSYFLEERKSALTFIVQDNDFTELRNQERLAEIFLNLKGAFGGFVDLGIIDSKGIQRSYIGPYELKGRNYKEQNWFKEVIGRGIYISDVFEGYRHLPHFVIAVKHFLADGDFFVLRATIDTERFSELVSPIDLRADSDAFIVTHDGVLQTKSRYYGDMLSKIDISLPACSEKIEICEIQNKNGQRFIMGYTYIPNSPFILVLLQKPVVLLQSWWNLKREVLVVLICSIIIILVVILGVATMLISRIYTADMSRLATLHNAEHANKMASIGRLAAGVAHEINNPLAIINERAGLIEDLFTFTDQYAQDEKLMSLVDSIIAQVDRCRSITQRLLGFARHIDVQREEIDLPKVVQEVLVFLEKEAKYRGIQIKLQAEKDLPTIICDRGQLQQIFLNIINNAFAAVDEGGYIQIEMNKLDENRVRIFIADDGCGIPPENLKRIFEPFFSTKRKKGGTGLGLSITYGLVKKLGGEIEVESQVGKGSKFTIILPVGRD
ncbi:sensor histidine kinase [Desulfovulcanus sp.]